MPANTTKTALNSTASPNNATFTYLPCMLFYFVHLSATLEPILGTMFAKGNNNYDTANGPCTEARLPNYQVTVPQGFKRCFFKSGFRYWYLVSQITGQIVPNSMIQIGNQGTPAQKCIGTSHYLEFINFQPIPQPSE